MQILRNIQRYKVLEIILFFVALLYYSFFANKGLVLFDEGYFVHSADRILHGEVPYRDFSLQYGPAYFYFLALFFKLFGATIIVERFYTVGICLAILVITFLIINQLRAVSYPVILLSFLCVIAYGYPLINIANIMWANVLIALLSVYVYLHWHTTQGRKNYAYLITIGALLALSLALKQNIGVACLFVFNFLILFSKKRPAFQIMKDIVVVNGAWLLITFGWIYYFFLRDNISGLLAVVNFSKKFASSMAFTIPPLTYITQPFGIFKLLPYYVPIAFGVFLLSYLFKKNKDWEKFGFAFIAVTGFAVTIFPESDLLHVYPFLGSVLVTLLLFGYTQKWRIYIILFLLINILIGFYLTFFTKSYRYEPPYSQMNTSLPLERTKDLLIEKQSAINLTAVYKFINTHTNQNDYILAYPYSPMLYFIFERKNPTKDPIYYQPTWHFYDDKIILNDIKQKKVKYIIVVAAYKYDTDISHFIQKQKVVFSSGNMLVYEIEL